MTEEQIIESEAFVSFFNTLLSMRNRGYDRDNTILMALRFDNFEDFYEEYKHLFIMQYSDEDKLLKAILRVFFCSQLSCLNNEEGEKSEGILNFCEKFVDKYFSEMKIILNKNHLRVVEAIIKNNKENGLRLKI